MRKTYLFGKITKTIHGAMRTFSQTTRVGIRNECAVKELIELAVERMMKKSVTDARLVDVARFRVGNPEMLIVPVPICFVAQIGMKG